MERIAQSSVIPFRYKKNRLEILLITSIRKKRWIIPKGIIEDDMTPIESAQNEAFEEAGISGLVSQSCYGNYDYKKWGAVCRVLVFAMEVKSVYDDWPERDMRQRKWVSADQASEIVKNQKIRPAIEKFIQAEKEKSNA